MGRLIDADALYLRWCGLYEGNVSEGEMDRMANMIASQPTVDAVPVVRCKDCKHYQHYGKTSLIVDGKNIKAGWCQRRIRYDEEHRMLPDDFCRYGERK